MKGFVRFLSSFDDCDVMISKQIAVLHGTLRWDEV